MAEPTSDGRGRRPASVRTAVAHYALTGIAALVLLGAAGVYLLRQIGEREAIRNAKQVAEVAGRGVVEPNLTAALVRQDPRAVAAFDRVVRQGALGGGVVRVKIWKPDGTIVYSDEHRLIGSRYPLDAADLRARE
jgi:hypothetical protein